MGGASRLAFRPTARGWQALLVGFLVLFVARLIGTTQFHQLAYALLALTFVALVLGWASSRGLRFSRALPPGVRITAGSPARIRLLLSNDSRFGSSGVRLADRLPEPRVFEAPPLKGDETTTIEASLYFAKRGVHELGPAEVGVTDPFGLLRFVRRFGEKTEVVVYPEVHELRDFPIRGGNVEVGARGSRGQRGDEFAGLREYRRGDDRRHIHWKSVARTGELYVKEFAVEAPRRYAVALDLRREGLRALEAEVEDAVSVAASVLTRLARERLPFRLVCADGAGNTTAFGSGEASYWAAMRLLATARADGARRLGQAVLAEEDALGEGVVLISRTRNEDLPAGVRRLRGAGLSVVVVAIATHTYRTPPGTGGAAQSREAEFLRFVDRVEAAGAAVRVVSHPAGVPTLSGTTARGAV
ncbi:MAG: hypothetical protein K0S10_781 [Rubrobacteraceae bacterium]|nr:hypothetical protein [Rubrobacteraceae bacterium]